MLVKDEVLRMLLGHKGSTVSGQEIADMLSCSRMAVSKAVSQQEKPVSSTSTAIAVQTPEESPEGGGVGEPQTTPEPTMTPVAEVEPSQEEVTPAQEESVQPQTETKELAYGAIPFELAAGTEKWWYIDSTDSAYWAVQENINAIRAEVGLPALTMDDSLSAAASARCESFVAGGAFDHSGMTTTGEILAAGPLRSASEVCQAWKDSPDHYANIVNENVSSMGVSCWFCDTDQGQYTYWAVTFG